jgi:hypothetical protein
VQAAARDEDRPGALRAGHFLAVRSIVRVLPHGVAAKAMLDAAIDACAAMQNIRAVIAQYRENIMSEAREEKRAKILSVCTVRDAAPGSVTAVHRFSMAPALPCIRVAAPTPWL